jgi:hypothetical protein
MAGHAAFLALLCYASCAVEWPQQRVRRAEKVIREQGVRVRRLLGPRSPPDFGFSDQIAFLFAFFTQV